MTDNFQTLQPNQAAQPPTDYGPPPIQTQQTSYPPASPQAIQQGFQNPPPHPISGPSTPFAKGPSAERSHNESPQQSFMPPASAIGPPQLPIPQATSPLYSQPPSAPGHSNSSTGDLPAIRPVFGVSLEDLLKRDGSAIPLVVYQCLQAVDLFGLEVEGIYRLSGSANHVAKLRATFNNSMPPADE